MRILLKPVVDFPLENLILAESTQFRTSQLTRSGGTLAAIIPSLETIHKMRIYQYLLFRIYMFYKDSKYESGNYTISTSLVSTLLISINLMTIYFLLEYNEILILKLNKGIVIIFMALVWALNYLLIVKKEEFLKFNFTKDKKGGYLIVAFILLTAFAAITVANFNREKIFERNNRTEIDK